MNILKSLFIIMGLVSITSFSTGAYFSDAVEVTGNSFTSKTLEAKVVINEIDYDQPGADTAEYLELKNVGDASADLSQYSIKLINGSDNSVYQTIVLPTGALAASDYYVMCSDSATVANCDYDIINLIQNGAPDAVALYRDGILTDTVSYEGNTDYPYTESSGIGLIDNSAVGSISRYPDGVDTNTNNIDFRFMNATPGAANI